MLNIARISSLEMTYAHPHISARSHVMVLATPIQRVDSGKLVLQCRLNQRRYVFHEYVSTTIGNICRQILVCSWLLPQDAHRGTKLEEVILTHRYARATCSFESASSHFICPKTTMMRGEIVAQEQRCRAQVNLGASRHDAITFSGLSQ